MSGVRVPHRPLDGLPKRREKQRFALQMQGFCRFDGSLQSPAALHLRGPCAGFCAALDCPLEVGSRHLPIVPHGDDCRVAQPGGCDVRGVLGDQFGGSGGKQIRKQLRPRLRSIKANDGSLFR
jgi:hypothetical protein